VVPGRVVVASSGLEAQLVPVGPPPADGCREGGTVARIEVLPSVIDAARLPAAAAGAACVPVGRRFDDLGVARLPLVPGDRLVVAGPPGSGRSSLLRLLVRKWLEAHPDHEVTWWSAPHGDPADALPAGTGLVVVDDAERIDDPGGRLGAIVSSRRSDVTVLLSGRADALRAGFDHWSVPARRHRLGFVMASTSELDGDILGVAPPRRCPIRPRPGLAWMIAHGAHTLVQTAVLPG
jgi:DNA segregation ATPase FtsK/SpoIIIE, S-DNA-T family